jgi:hypothetical protein
MVMSCLILADMSLSDQIAIELAHADRQTLTVEGELAKLEQMLGMRKDRAAERAQQFPVRRAAPHAAGQPVQRQPQHPIAGQLSPRSALWLAPIHRSHPHDPARDRTRGVDPRTHERRTPRRMGCSLFRARQSSSAEQAARAREATHSRRRLTTFNRAGESR